MYATDRQTSDKKHHLIPPPIMDRGITIEQWNNSHWRLPSACQLTCFYSVVSVQLYILGNSALVMRVRVLDVVMDQTPPGERYYY